MISPEAAINPAENHGSYVRSDDYGGDENQESRPVGNIELEESIRRLEQRRRLRAFYKSHYQQPRHQKQQPTDIDHTALLVENRNAPSPSLNVPNPCTNFDAGTKPKDTRKNKSKISSNSGSSGNNNDVDVPVAVEPDSNTERRMKWTEEDDESSEPLMEFPKSPSAPRVGNVHRLVNQFTNLTPPEKDGSWETKRSFGSPDKTLLLNKSSNSDSAEKNISSPLRAIGNNSNVRYASPAGYKFPFQLPGSKSDSSAGLQDEIRSLSTKSHEMDKPRTTDTSTSSAKSQPRNNSSASARWSKTPGSLSLSESKDSTQETQSSASSSPSSSSSGTSQSTSGSKENWAPTQSTSTIASIGSRSTVNLGEIWLPVHSTDNQSPTNRSGVLSPTKRVLSPTKRSATASNEHLPIANSRGENVPTSPMMSKSSQPEEMLKPSWPTPNISRASSKYPRPEMPKEQVVNPSNSKEASLHVDNNVNPSFTDSTVTKSTSEEENDEPDSTSHLSRSYQPLVEEGEKPGNNDDEPDQTASVEGGHKVRSSDHPYDQDNSELYSVNDLKSPVRFASQAPEVITPVAVMHSLQNKHKIASAITDTQDVSTGNKKNMHTGNEQNEKDGSKVGNKERAYEYTEEDEMREDAFEGDVREGYKEERLGAEYDDEESMYDDYNSEVSEEGEKWEGVLRKVGSTNTPSIASTTSSAFSSFSADGDQQSYGNTSREKTGKSVTFSIDQEDNESNYKSRHVGYDVSDDQDEEEDKFEVEPILPRGVDPTNVSPFPARKNNDDDAKEGAFISPWTDAEVQADGTDQSFSAGESPHSESDQSSNNYGGLTGATPPSSGASSAEESLRNSFTFSFSSGGNSPVTVDSMSTAETVKRKGGRSSVMLRKRPVSGLRSLAEGKQSAPIVDPNTPNSLSGAPLLSSYQAQPELPQRRKPQQQTVSKSEQKEVWNRMAKSTVFRGTDAFAAAMSGNVPLVHFLLDTMLEAVAHSQQGGLYPKFKSEGNVDLLAVVDEKDQFNTLLHCGAVASDPGVVELLLKLHGKRFPVNKKESPSVTYESYIESLVNCKNEDGETALLRAACHGRLSIIKSLILHRADLCALDNNKNNIVITTARSGQLFTLHFLLSLCPSPIVHRLLKGRDIDGHSALEWAAYNGHVHIIEYLLYRGMDANEVDYKGRNALHWAASQNQLHAVAYLLALDMDPTLCDADGNSVVSMSKWPSHHMLKLALSNPGRYCGHRAGATHGSQSTFVNGLFNRIVRRNCVQIRLNSEEDDSPTARVQAVLGNSKEEAESYNASRSKMGVHPARNRKNKTRMNIFLVYALLSFGAWCCLFLVRFYISVPALITFAFLMNKAKETMYTVEYTKPETIEANGFVHSVLTARETHVGFFYGSLCFYITTIAVAFITCKWDQAAEIVQAVDPVDLGGNAFSFWAESVDTNFIISIVYVGTLILMATTLTMLVFLCPDPGAIHEDRTKDYVRLLADVAENGSDPDTRKWCTATMQRKPFRAKYDDPTGLLVARHDHHCVWLNNTIGYGNHRLFMVFIVSHLFTHALFLAWSILAMVRYINELDYISSCSVISSLFSTTMFGMLCMAVFSAVCMIGLALLTYHQTKNIMDNMTTNERINWRRYPWLTTEDGEFFNQFDTGSKWQNVKLFWIHDQEGGMHDYYRCYDIRPGLRRVITKVKRSNLERRYGKMDDDCQSFELETNPSDINETDSMDDNFEVEIDIA